MESFFKIFYLEPHLEKLNMLALSDRLWNGSLFFGTNSSSTTSCMNGSLPAIHDLLRNDIRSFTYHNLHHIILLDSVQSDALPQI